MNKLKLITTTISILILVTSCIDLNTIRNQITWNTTSKEEIDKLINSPEEITFEKEKYILSLSFNRPIFETSRGGFISVNNNIVQDGFMFFYLKNTSSENYDILDKFKIVSLYIINKNKKFILKVENIERMGLNTFRSNIINEIYPIDGEGDFGVIYLNSTKDKFYLKSKVAIRR